jgi:phage tail-like protein
MYKHNKITAKPITNNRYIVDIPGMPQLNFSSVSEISDSSEVTEIREGSKPFAITKVPGVTHNNPIVLIRAFTGNNSIENWRDEIRNFDKGDNSLEGRYRTVIISILDMRGDLFKKITLKNAWPSRYNVGALDANNVEILLETVELQYERITIENYSSSNSGASNGGNVT